MLAEEHDKPDPAPRAKQLQRAYGCPRDPKDGQMLLPADYLAASRSSGHVQGTKLSLPMAHGWSRKSSAQPALPHAKSSQTLFGGPRNKAGRISFKRATVARSGSESATMEALSGPTRALGPYILPPPRHGVLGVSRQAQKLRDQVLQVSKDPKRAPVLVIGEAGAGTGEIAALLHYSSCKTGLPLVKVNCQRLGGSSGIELFGRGAKPGLLGLLKGMPPGTSILLEDAHLLSAGLLPRMCELLRTGSWLAASRPGQGDSAGSQIDCGLEPGDPRCSMQTLDEGSVRIIMTSEQAVPELADLIPWTVKVPPLRARPSDIPSLVTFYLTHEVPIPPKLIEAQKKALSGKGNGVSAATKPQLHLPSTSLKRMQAYGWPGNELELSLVVLRAARQHVAGQSVAANTGGVAAMAMSTEINDRLIVWGDMAASSPRLDLFDAVPYLRDIVRSPIWPDGINKLTAYAYPVLIALLIFGPQDRDHNPFLNIFWCWWWPAMYLLYPIAGRVWCAVCPFMIYGELAQKWRVAQGVVLKRWPRKEVETWGPVFLFSLFTVILTWEEVWDLANNGALSAYLLLLITAGAVVCSSFFERRMWCRYLCPIGGMNGLMAKGSATEIRAREGVCAGNCSTYHCIKGGCSTPGGQGLDTNGCPLYIHPAQLADNRNCTYCMSCVKACPNRSVQFRLRPPLADIWDGHDASWGELALLGLLAGAVYLHSLSMDGGPLAVQLGIGPELVSGVSQSHILLSMGILFAPSVAVAATDVLGRLWTRHVVHVDEPAPLLTLGYGYLPLVWASTLAFYLDWLMLEGGKVLQVAGAMVGYPAAATLPAIVAAPPVVDFVQALSLGLGWLASLALTRRVAGTPTWVSIAPHALLITALTAELWVLTV